jgi:hypothetical protein
MPQKQTVRKFYLCLDNTAEALLSDTEEHMTSSGSSARVNGDANTAVGGIFEASRHR